MAVAPLEEIGLAEDVMPLGQLLLRSARRDPDKEALVFPDERVSYRELADTRVGRRALAAGARRPARRARRRPDDQPPGPGVDRCSARR